MRPYLITAKLMRPSNMKRFPTPILHQFKRGQFRWFVEFYALLMYCKKITKVQFQNN
jgi:hypothetical protein